MLEFAPTDELFIGTSLLNEFYDCTTCGLCCMAFENLPIYSKEVAALSSRLDINKQQFERLYTKPYQDSEGDEQRSLQTPCRFLKDKQCSIYPLRPLICRCYPLVVNLTTNEAVLSGIYFCPQATQLYEGLIEYYATHNPLTHKGLLDLEEKMSVSSKGWELHDTKSLIATYIDSLYQPKKSADTV